MIIPAWPCGQPKPQPNHGADHSPRAVSAGSEITAQITHPITAQITAPTRRLAPRRSFEFGCDLAVIWAVIWAVMAVICLWFGCEIGGSLPSPAGGPPCGQLKSQPNHGVITAPEPCPKSQHKSQTKSQPLLGAWHCLVRIGL